MISVALKSQAERIRSVYIFCTCTLKSQDAQRIFLLILGWRWFPLVGKIHEQRQSLGICRIWWVWYKYKQYWSIFDIWNVFYSHVRLALRFFWVPFYDKYYKGSGKSSNFNVLSTSIKKYANISENENKNQSKILSFPCQNEVKEKKYWKRFRTVVVHWWV